MAFGSLTLKFSVERDFKYATNSIHIVINLSYYFYWFIIAKKKEEKESDSSEVTSILNQLKLDDSVVVSSAIAPPVAAITLEELEKSLIKKDVIEDDFEDEEDMPRSGETFETYAQRIGTELTPKQAQRITELVPKNMILFKFDGDILTAGQSPILVCSVCNNEGHLQKDCPEEQLPPLKPLPRFAKYYIEQCI